MILGFKDSLNEQTNKSLECLIKLGFFPKSEQIPFLPHYDPTLNTNSHLVRSSCNASTILAAPSSPMKCSGNLVRHIAQSLCPLPGKSQSNFNLKAEVVVYVAVTGCHIEFHTSVFCNASLFTVISYCQIPSLAWACRRLPT